MMKKYISNIKTKKRMKGEGGKMRLLILFARLIKVINCNKRSELNYSFS